MRTKLETLVGIKFEIEGMHCYPNASANHGDSVKFLEQPHRHLFKFNCKKRVNHDNRDEEFILLKNRVESYIKHNTPIIAGTAIYDFGSQSCEQIAKKVLKQFDFEEVEVSEDGENYAVVKKVPEDGENEQQNECNSKRNANILFVVGGCCSGKTYFTQKLSDKKRNVGEKTCVFEVGDIVRHLTNTQDRIFNKYLNERIVEMLNDLIKSAISEGCENIIVTGCRQIEVFKGVTLGLDQKDYHVIYLSVPKSKRRLRFEKRLFSKDKDKSFEDVLSGEKSIGFDDFIEYLINEEYDNLTIIKNVEE